MTALEHNKLLDRQKLEILRRYDRYRQWTSVDDKRYCIACGSIISGRDIQVIPNASNDVVGIHCPTERCRSIPMDWILPPPEILALLSILVEPTIKAD